MTFSMGETHRNLRDQLLSSFSIYLGLQGGTTIEVFLGQSPVEVIPVLLRKTWLVFACGVAYLLYAIICQMQDAVPWPLFAPNGLRHY